MKLIICSDAGTRKIVGMETPSVGDVCLNAAMTSAVIAASFIGRKIGENIMTQYVLHNGLLP